MDKSLYIQDNHQFIMSLILKGTPIENILRTLGVDSSRFNSFFTNKPVQTILGNKDETYFNEEDLLTENYNFNFNDLSYDEQQIYLEREKAGVLGRYFASSDGLHGGYKG
jgi:hypothetical protein